MGRRLVLVLVLACEVGVEPTDETTPPPCGIVTDTATCAINFQPTWGEFYERILAPGHDCSCHESGGMPDAAHVNFLSSDHAYEYLLESWVTPGDPACSPLMHMFENGRMPPTITGKPGLDAQDICAIAKWIEAGAHQ